MGQKKDGKVKRAMPAIAESLTAARIKARMSEAFAAGSDGMFLVDACAGGDVGGVVSVGARNKMKVTFNKLCDQLAKQLPDGWEVIVRLGKGYGQVELLDTEHDKSVEFVMSSDANKMDDQVKDALEFAKKAGPRFVRDKNRRKIVLPDTPVSDEIKEQIIAAPDEGIVECGECSESEPEPELTGVCERCEKEGVGTRLFSGWAVDNVELCDECFGNASMEE